MFLGPEANIAPPNYAYQPMSSSLIGKSFPYNFRWMRGCGFKTHWVSVTYQSYAYYCWLTIEVVGSWLIFSNTNKNGNKIHFILTTKQRVSWKIKFIIHAARSHTNRNQTRSTQIMNIFNTNLTIPCDPHALCERACIWYIQPSMYGNAVRFTEKNF